LKSVNYKLREVYVASLSTLTVNTVPIPIYYLELPQDENPSNYILISDVANVEDGTMYKHTVNTSMQLSIYTIEQYGNSGKMADDIVNEIFNTIYPTTISTLDLGVDFQMVTMNLVSDRVENLTTDGNDYFANRNLTFQHKIFIK
jgi:hypothetical protein